MEFGKARRGRPPKSSTLAPEPAPIGGDAVPGKEAEAAAHEIRQEKIDKDTRFRNESKRTVHVTGYKYRPGRKNTAKLLLMKRNEILDKNYSILIVRRCPTKIAEELALLGPEQAQAEHAARSKKANYGIV